MHTFELKQLSSLENVFLTDNIADKKEFNSFSALWGEVFSYQITYKSTNPDKAFGKFSVESPIKDYVDVFYVHHVPCGRTYHPDFEDNDYLKQEPGLYPDALIPQDEGEIFYTPDDFHGVKVFSPKHWKLLEKYVKTAVECGINMILTPVITPPLDIAIGGERTTIQLVDVSKNKGKYSFDFSKLGRWVKMCRKCGIKHFEMSHLFSQWGAKCSPKIMATVDGEYKRIFGWDIAADSKEYSEFLDSFLPELDRYIEEIGIKDVTYFHTSDEPNDQHIGGYKNASSLLKKHLKGYKFMDAVSHLEFKDYMDIPVVCVANMQDFIDAKVDNAWIYTCCYPPHIYANRFIAMPSGRNRIMGTMMYKYNIPGYLHWGYNFYNSQLSKKHINPYTCTDSEYAFPAGDPFSVYPCKDGAIHSIRSRVFYDGLQDIRTFQLLEKAMSHDEVVEVIEKYGKITLNEYSKGYDILLKIKQDVHKIIKEKLL